jgi:hypothetical protein
MYRNWSEVLSEMQRIVATSADNFAPESIQNAKDLVAFATDQWPAPDGVRKGYWPIFSSFFWSTAAPAPIEIEVHEDHYEVYHSVPGTIDIKYFDHKPGEPIPDALIVHLAQVRLNR